MNIQIVDLDDDQTEDIGNRLEAYDKQHITYKLDGYIHIGAMIDGKIAGGIDACMTAFHILYISTVYIDPEYRRKGIGRMLMLELEKRAGIMGANMIRLDTFDWQGKDFYLSLGYEQIGYYHNESDGFSEYFFLKRI